MPCIDMSDIVDRLAEFYSLDEIDTWLSSPHPQLGGQTAEAVIARGDKAAVLAVIDRLAAGGYI